MDELVLLIERLSQIATAPLLALLLATCVGVVLVRNWQLSVPLLIVQYVLVAILLARAVQPGLALIKGLAGLVVCLALSVAAQRADDARTRRGESIAAERLDRFSWRASGAQFIIRAVALLVMLALALGASSRFPVPNLPRELLLAAYCLGACAVLLIATTTDALNVGIGLLMFGSAIEVAYAPIEASVSVVVLLALLTLLIGIAVAYLTLMDSGNQEKRAMHGVGPE